MLRPNRWKGLGKCLLIALLPGILIGWAWVEAGFWSSFIAYCVIILSLIATHWFWFDVWERPPHIPWYTA